jgi:hypothetical protein
MTIKLTEAALHFKMLPHQIKAFQDLQDSLSPMQLEIFASAYRSSQPASRQPVDKLKLLSQRNYRGDLNKDGRDDSFQTCNVHALAMCLNAILNRNIAVAALDAQAIKMPGSRYSHDNLVKISASYNVKSVFNTATPTAKIIEHLDKGLPVIWSNKLTHSGHIVVLAKYNKETKAFFVYDSYGEPMIGNKVVYRDIRKPYWLSLSSFNRFGMNGANSSGHWAHLLSC